MAHAIEHVVIIVKENHGFDNYFGTFPGANGATLPHSPNPPPHDPDHRHKAWLTRHSTATKAQFSRPTSPPTSLTPKPSPSATTTSPTWPGRPRPTT